MSQEQQPLHALPQGHRLQEYELVRVLGFGGFGMTYLGFDHNLDKAVAIKEYLPSDIATRTADHSVAPQASDFCGDFQWGLDRFLDEARTLARFDHRHIIKVHRFFEAHGTAYIVMEYAEGETLSAYLERKGTLSEAELKGILYPLLDGLEVVHGADFLHRDIKPGNIVLRDRDGSPVLLDFGAARQAIGVKSRSVTSIVTPGYAPIEQYSSRGDQGPWTDIYALGGMCYRALTGQVPDDATDRVRNDPLIPVAECCAGQASREFLSAIDMALSVDEGDRPQSVGAWRTALEAGSASLQEHRQEETTRRDTRQSASENQRRERKEILDKVRQIEEQVALEADAREGKVHRESAAQRSSFPEQASLAEDRDKFVAEMGREPSHWGRTHGATDLHISARLNLPMLTRSLLTQGADVHAKDNDGYTPLHLAAWEDASATTEVLLNQGADVHAKIKYGSTPLHLAAWEDASATTEVLLASGADVHAKNEYGSTPLDVAVYRNAHKTVEVLRRYGGHTAATIEVLPKQGADARNNKSSGEEKMGCIAMALVGMGIIVLIGLLSC